MKRRLTALVVGNGDYYNNKPLENPINDANDVEEKLKKYGFEVIKRLDANIKELNAALTEFEKRLNDNDVGLFFFAGHGMQCDGENFLVAVDSEVDTTSALKRTALSLNSVLSCMDKGKAGTRIIILDACRDNPLKKAWDRSVAARGMAAVYAPRGTLIAFATSPGQTAADGVGRRNGIFTGAILKHIDAKNTNIEMMFKQVRNTVAAATSNKQTTWEHTSLSGEFRFNMGIQEFVSDYRPDVLADSMFVLDNTKPSHEIIRSLKTLSWHSQNPAVEKLTVTFLKKMTADNLFITGRNIYQAACGSSNAAAAFINDFANRTSGLDAERKKALLDGMLFEIFFNNNGELRGEIKAEMFNETFALQAYADLSSSFDFIADALANSPSDFYAIPGRSELMSVAVNTQMISNDYYKVRSIFVGSTDVLRPGSDDYATDDPSERMFRKMEKDAFEDLLSRELIVPKRLLHIDYNPPNAIEGLIGVPYGWTVRKPSPA